MWFVGSGYNTFGRMGSLLSWMRAEGAARDSFTCSVKSIDKYQWMMEIPQDPSRPLFMNFGVLAADGYSESMIINGQRVVPVGTVYALVETV